MGKKSRQRKKMETMGTWNVQNEKQQVERVQVVGWWVGQQIWREWLGSTIWVDQAVVVIVYLLDNGILERVSC